MNKLILSVNTLPAHTDIFLDGKYFKPKKVKNQHPVIEYETENNTVELTLKKYSHLSTRLWVLQEIFFFIISIFGILDKKFGNYFYKEHCKIIINVSTETKTTIRFNPPLAGKPVVSFKGDCEITEVENIYELDKELKRKNKILKFIKFLIFIAFVATLLVFIL